MSMERHGGLILTGETEDLGTKPAPASLLTQQIPRELIQARYRAYALRSRRLAA
jgi:hypothetical protein